VKYIPITNPIIINSKQDTPFNETQYKPLARSYDKSSNNIDYDLMMDSFDKTNNMLGRAEISIEYDLGDGEQFYAGQQVMYKYFGDIYYITSIIYKYTFSKDYALINLSKSYYKIADSIGVKTQFNAVKNPLDNVIERPIYFKLNATLYDYIASYNNKLYFKFIFSSGQTLYKKCVLMSYNGAYHAYCETIDQYTFDKKSIIVSGNNNLECRDISYCDVNNECQSMKVSLVAVNEISYSGASNLPGYPGTLSAFTNEVEITLYKDAREKLTFTAEIFKS
jgi:hypothetical protein